MKNLSATNITKENLSSLENGMHSLFFQGSMEGKIEKLVFVFGEGDHSLLDISVETDLGERIIHFTPKSTNQKVFVFYPRTAVHNTDGSIVREGPNISKIDKISHRGKIRVNFLGLQKGEVLDLVSLFYS